MECRGCRAAGDRRLCSKCVRHAVVVGGPALLLGLGIDVLLFEFSYPAFTFLMLLAVILRWPDSGQDDRVRQSE